MKKRKEQDTELGMLTHRWATLKAAAVILPGLQTGLHFPPMGKLMQGLGQAKRAQLLLLVAPESSTGQKGYKMKVHY